LSQAWISLPWGDARKARAKEARAQKAQAKEAQAMAHLVEKQFLERANSALMLGLVCGGLAICAFGAVAFDLTRWFAE
jgi:hypothetical protein